MSTHVPLAPDGPTPVMPPAEIDNRFTFHAPGDDADRIARHERIRELCRNLAHELNVMLPPGHLSERALDTLGDVMCQANMAVACAGGPSPEASALHQVPKLAAGAAQDLAHGGGR